MNKSTIIILFLILSHGLAAQTTSISLKNYCPTEEWQADTALCFAYATTYTALSIEHNVKDNNTNEGSQTFNSFSFGFVASVIKKNKSFWGRLFNRCGRGATARLALSVLEKYGTVDFDEFREPCKCNKIDKVSDNANKFKIEGFSELGTSESDDVIHIENIKQNLINKKPVITTILQESFFLNANGLSDITFPEGHQESSNNANHVVCIVGFDDNRNGGSFIIKNNYEKWGENGFSYVKYEDFIKLIRISYTIII